MTVVALDTFTRSSPPTLPTNPSGRWVTPAPGGALANVWSLDGQNAYTDIGTQAAPPLGPYTGGVTPSTLCYARMILPLMGSGFGKVSIKIRRSNAHCTQLGVLALCSRSSGTANERLFFGWTSGNWQLLYYSAYSTVGGTLASVAESGANVMGTAQKTIAIKVQRIGTTNQMTVECTVDGLIVIAGTFLNPLNAATTPTQFGFQCTTSSQWNNTTYFNGLYNVPLIEDYVYVDEISFDDLATGNAESAPAVPATATYTTITTSTENTGTTSTLPIEPDFGELVSPISPVVETRTEAGYDILYNAELTNGPRARMKLTYQTISSADYAILVAFLESHSGPQLGFSFTSYVSGVTTWYFVPGTLSADHLASGVFGNLTLEIQEARS